MRKRLKACGLLLVFAVALIGLVACGKKKEDKQVDIDSLHKDMIAVCKSLPDMSVISSEDKDGKENFAYLADIDYDLVESYFFEYSSKGLADEIAVIVLKDEADAGKAKAALEDHLKSRKLLFKNYEPEEANRAESAKIFVSGNVVAFVMCDNVKEVKAAFEKDLDK